MSFLERLRPCRYTSALGEEFELLFNDVERSFERKAAVHELPGRDIADIQDLGNQAEKYPLDLYFAGPEYDVAADLFYRALRERGPGKLKHPRWGDHDVLALRVSQSEKFVEGTHCAHFQVEFIDSPDPKTLTVSGITISSIQASAGASADAISAGVGAIEVSVIDGVTAKGKAFTLVGFAKDTLKAINGITAEVSSQLAAAQRQIVRDIDSTGIPELYGAIVALYRLPAQIDTEIKAKVQAYSDIINNGIASFDGFMVEVASLLGLTTAAAESTTEGTFRSRGEAMDAYNSLTDISALVFATVEKHVKDRASFASVIQLSSDARARLLVESYSLPTERSMVLQGDTDPITLATKLYGDPERHKELITDNHLGDASIFVIPRGTRIYWYE